MMSYREIQKSFTMAKFWDHLRAQNCGAQAEG